MHHRRNWPDAAWHFDFEVPASLSDRYGELVSIAGTVSLDTQGKLRAPNDLDSQLALVMAELDMIVNGAGVNLDSVAKLVAFYVDSPPNARDRVINAMRQKFPLDVGPALSAIPVDNLAFPGMMLEIEGYALADLDGMPLARSAPALGTLKSGDWLFIDTRACRVDGGGALQTQAGNAADKLQTALLANQSSLSDVVRLNVYYNSNGGNNDLTSVAQALAERFEQPGPVVTFVPLPTLAQTEQWVEIDAIAMPGAKRETPSGGEPQHLPGWSWPSDWPFVQSLRCGDAIFIGGQCAFDEQRNIINPGDMESQTRQVMDRIVGLLAAYGATYDDVMKVGCWYNGGASVEVLKRNALIRTSYMTKPGATSTGVPVRTCFATGSEIQIDVVAMTEER